MFDIQGPDEHGHIWICSTKDEPAVQCFNLGPKDEVAEIMSQWLGSIDYEETEARRLIPVNRKVIGGRDE